MKDWVSQSLDLRLFWEYRDTLLSGLWYNAGIFVCAAILALLIGLGVCLMRISRSRSLRIIGLLHTEIFRNAPDYVMLIWVHLVLPLLIGMVLARRFELDPFVSSFIALGFVYSGYLAETFRAGFEAIPKGNIEAGRALGMSNFLLVRRIMLPQVIRRMLPEAMNNFVSLFKATSIVSLIAVPDLMYRVTMVTQQEMKPIPLYTGAALTYFIVILVVASIARAFAERWRRLAPV